MKVAVLGRTQVLLNCLYALVEAGHDVVLIGTCAESKEYGLEADQFESAAKELGSKYFYNSRINSPEIVQMLIDSGAEIAISVNWLTLIQEEAIDAFPLGILNAHAGDLPRYRGNACPNWAMLQGEASISIAIHQMLPGELDAGPILCKDQMPIDENTVIRDVYNYVEERIPKLFVEALEGLETGKIVPVAQPSDPALALRCYPRIPSDSFLDWRKPADFLARLVRASSEPFAGAYTYYQGERFIVWRAFSQQFAVPSLATPGQVVWRSEADGTVAVATGEGVLVIQDAELKSRGRRSPSELITSMRARLGVHVEDELYELKKRICALEEKFHDGD